MQRTESAEFVHIQTPYLGMALAKHFAMMAHLGVESSGRSRRHVEQNLLKAGRGARVGDDGMERSRRPSDLAQSDNDFIYTCRETGVVWQTVIQDDRTFVVRLHRPGGKLGGHDPIFRMSFSPAICPVNVWGEWLDEKPFPPSRRSSLFDVPDAVVNYRLPLLLHFPEYGAFKVTCADPDITARQTMSADPDEVGLNLGCTNTAYHTSRVAYHRGEVEVSFHAHDPVERLELVFSVEPEHYPHIEGVDFSGDQWNGLKRCWQNSFTLNPETISMGDNPVLHGIAHLAIHFKSDVSVFTPPLLEGLSLHKFFHRALQITFRDCVGESGEIHARHAAAEGRKRKTGDFGFFDANISNLIALHNYTAATGDWSLVRENLANVRQAGRFLMALDRDGDGILELPFDGDAFRDTRECRNWWDNFPFGHKDGFINLLAYRGLGDLAVLLKGVGGQDGDVKKIEAWRALFASHFNEVFFNPETGVHVGWISADGRMHDYLFTFISSMAINQGLVPQRQAKAIVNTLLERLRAEGYGGWKWGIPGPLQSVSESDGHIWAPMQRWGSYENGGLCGQTAYHFIEALYRAGMRDTADEILFTMLDTFEHEPTHSGVFPGYMQSVDWRTREGMPCGYNYLADNYYFLLAGVTGHFGVPMPVAKGAG